MPVVNGSFFLHRMIGQLTGWKAEYWTLIGQENISSTSRASDWLLKAGLSSCVPAVLLTCFQSRRVEQSLHFYSTLRSETCFVKLFIISAESSGESAELSGLSCRVTVAATGEINPR